MSMEVNTVIESYVRLCPNLIKVLVSPMTINEDKELLKKVQHIVSTDFQSLTLDSKEVKKILIDKYSQTLKTLEH